MRHDLPMIISRIRKCIVELNTVKQCTLLALVRACGIRFDALKFRGDRRHSSVEFRGSDMASSRINRSRETTDGTDITRGIPGWMRAGAFL